MNESGLKRKKQPEAVRRALLDAAWHLAYQNGLAGVTVQAVATRAGVTKGGLFHHFASKQALIESLHLDLIEKLDEQIDAFMADDPEPAGSFTRAYVRATLRAGDFTGDAKLVGLSAAFMVDPVTSKHWIAWITARLERHAATDSDPVLEIVRYAADGAWYNFLESPPEPGHVEALTTRLIGMTRSV